MGYLVLEARPCEDKAVNQTNVTQWFTVIIPAAQCMLSHNLFHIFVLITDFCIQVSHNNDYMSVALIDFCLKLVWS